MNANKKYRIFCECVENPEYQMRLYLEFLNREPYFDITYDEFSNSIDECFSNFLIHEQFSLKGLFKKKKEDTSNEDNKEKKKFFNFKKKDKPKKGVSKIVNNIENTTDNLDKTVNKVNNVIDDNSKNIKKTTEGAKKLVNNTNNIIDDNRNNIKQTIDNVSNITNDAAKRYSNITKKVDSIKKNGKKGLIGTGVVAGVGITAMAIKKAKDKKKYQAWKNKNLKQRQYIGMKQWIDLGKPLDEATDLFIEGYFDAIIESYQNY